MNNSMKRNIFLVIIVLLVVAVIGIAVFVATKGPSTPGNIGTEVVNKDTDDGKILIKDLYDGEINIPKYNYPLDTYDMESFQETNGVMKYGEDSALGINVRSKEGEVDWEKVKGSGVDFVMLRAGYRGYKRGERNEDENFEKNYTGATEAGLDVGVYFFSQAVSEQEAEQEASFVLSLVQGKQIKYPIAFDWEKVEDTGSDKVARTDVCTPTDVTNFAKAYCGKIKKAGFTPAIYMNKDMGYEYFNLSELSDYEIWYSEYQKTPAFYYDFKIWQYSNQGTVPGIDKEVRMNIAMKKY